MATETFTEVVEDRFVSRAYIGDSFETNRAVIENMLDDILTKSAVSNILAAFPEASLGAKRRDTSVGGNDAINCYYQFNENDDIIHPINKTGSDETAGMGRVYNETFDQQQQILYLSFGVPDFSNAASFVKDLYNQNLATLMNTGDVSVINQIGQFIGFTIGHVVTLPLWPIRLANKIFTGISPSKYYDIRPTMALYYKSVNVILAHLAANMNIIPEDEQSDLSGVPLLFKQHGLDILTILAKKYHYDHLSEASQEDVDSILKKLSNDHDYEKNMWARGLDGLLAGVTEALLHVGFRVEKSSDSSESASNSTKEPDILGKLNSAVSSAKENTYNLASLRETGIGQMLDSVYQGAMGIASGLAKSMSIQGGVELLKGSGLVDMPELYASSQFAKSYSFNFQLRTPYGDAISIFYSLYIPLALLLAGAFPRSVGQNTYTSPFLVRAFCKGMFAIPMGIIDSIHIQRGAAEYGWSDQMLPTQIDISFTIKDLSPVMHIAITDDGITDQDWLAIFGQNSTFQDYMMTLAGSDIADRILRYRLLKKRAKAVTTIVNNNKLNPIMAGFSLSNTKLGNLITRMNPKSRLPGAVTKINN